MKTIQTILEEFDKQCEYWESNSEESIIPMTKDYICTAFDEYKKGLRG